MKPLRTILIVLLLASAAHAQPLGSVLISRNLDERQNTSPGYWNHLAIIADSNYVVESQDGYGVLLTPISDYMHRAYQVGIMYPPSIAVGQRAAEIARTFVGRPFRRASSLAPLLIPPIIPMILHGTPDGMNCVSVISEAYRGATGRPIIGLRIPDDALRHPEILTNQLPQ